jgi:hypothetical protein
MLRRVVLVGTDVFEELTASIIRVTRIGELGTTLAVTSNRRPILVTLIMAALNSTGTWELTRAHAVTSHKTPFFIVTAVRTSNLT